MNEFVSRSVASLAPVCGLSLLMSFLILDYHHHYQSHNQRVDYVDMDGPTVVLRLKGRFWHQRTTVLERVANYLQQRIPEIIDVTVEDEWQLTKEANEAF